jgi:hypothetical protein
VALYHGWPSRRLHQSAQRHGYRKLDANITEAMAAAATQLQVRIVEQARWRDASAMHRNSPPAPAFQSEIAQCYSLTSHHACHACPNNSPLGLFCCSCVPY